MLAGRSGEDVVAQTKEVVPIFEFLHPGKTAWFVYDNSTNHSVYPPGALGVPQGVNKNPGGVKAPGSEILPEEDAAPVATKSYRPKMVDGWYLAPDGTTRIVQKMHEEDDVRDPANVVPGVFRGTEAILKERGFFPGAAKVAKGACKRKAADVEPDLPCCCKHLLAAQPDFLAQPTALEALLHGAGHLHKMLPKCHPVRTRVCRRPARFVVFPRSHPHARRGSSVARVVSRARARARARTRARARAQAGSLTCMVVVAPPSLHCLAGAQSNRAVVGRPQGIPAAQVRLQLS